MHAAPRSPFGVAIAAGEARRAMALVALGGAGLWLLGRLPAVLPQVPAYSEAGGVARVEGVITSEVFIRSAPLAFTPPSRRVLWGLLDAVQSMPAGQFGVLLLAAVIAFALGVRAAGVDRWRMRAPVAALAALVVLSGLLSLRLSSGWDEFYINLRHSQNVIDHARYSLNAADRIEATVDLAPFLAAGVVGRITGVLPDNVALLCGFFGNVLLIAFAFLFVRRLTARAAAACVAAACMALFPPVLYVGASGFMGTLFAGGVLACLYPLVLLRGRWSFRGIMLLGLLPLVRIEAAALGALIWGLTIVAAVVRQWRRQRRLTRWARRSAHVHAWRLFALLGPFVALAAARKAYFGFAIPIPVSFKNTNGDVSYVVQGLRQLFDVARTLDAGAVLLVFAFPVALLLVRRGARLAIAFASLALFSLTYVVGGGDWFPLTWARYWIPMLAFALVVALASMHALLRALKVRRPTLMLIATVLLVAGVSLDDASSAVSSVFDDVRFGGSNWRRVDQLARLGDLFRRTSTPDWRIGSPEVATMMFFAERDVVGLLGVDNPDVAFAPLTPIDPGDRVHRRRNPETLEAKRPAFVALYEPSMRAQPFVNLRQLQSRFRELVRPIEGYYRAGSFDYLQAIGYRAVTVQADSDVFTYWVHDAVYDAHRRRLIAEGFAPQGVIHAPYLVAPGISRRFRPSSAHYAALHHERADAVDHVVLEGAMRASAAPPNVRRPVGGSVVGSWAGAPARGVARFALSTSHGFGELRVPVLQGSASAGLALRLVDAASRDTVARIALPQGYVGEWLTLRVRAPVGGRALELVAIDAGDDAEAWIAVGAPWWMGERRGATPPSRNDPQFRRRTVP